MYKDKPSKKLLYTTRGSKWLNQFDYGDQENASKLVQYLTLVSHNEFERNLLKFVEDNINNIGGTVALFAVREVDTNQTFFNQAKSSSKGEVCLDSLSRGNNHGSEARVAAMIRNLCRESSSTILNHPTIEKIRKMKCNEIIFLDDFIGSGNRVFEFLTSFWRHPTIASWLSLKYLKFRVLSYSGTEKGTKTVSRHRSNPKVSTCYPCPTIESMLCTKTQRDAVIELCRKYGEKSHKNKNMWFGYRQTKGTLIFEHGCPNNVPSILWGRYNTKESWYPLFPKRTVSSEEGSIFPHEIIRGDPISLLLSVGQKRLAKSGAFNYTDEEGEIILLVLALLAKRQYRISTLSYATALNKKDCEKILDRCLRWGLITQTRRLTKKGYSELQAARKTKLPPTKSMAIGDDYYYPMQLRVTTSG